MIGVCAEIDERVDAFLSRPLEGAWPYLWLDATYLKVREGGRIISKAVIIAVAVNEDGKREVQVPNQRRVLDGTLLQAGSSDPVSRPLRHTAPCPPPLRRPRDRRAAYAAAAGAR